MMQLSTHATVQRAACASITKRSPARLLLRPNPDATRHPSSSVLLKASSPGSDAADGVAKSYVDLGSRQLYDRSSVRCGFHPEDGKEGKTSTKTDLENPDKKTVQRHVILAIDESKVGSESEAMVDWAFNNVLREGDTADLVHIISAVPGGMVFRIPGQPSLYRVPSSKQKSHGLLVSQDDYLQEQNEAIQSKFVYQAEMSKVHLQTHVVCSSVANSKAKLGKIINNIATDAHGSAVLVSSHSKGGLTEVLIGSVADWLVHNCKTPLIVLHGVPHSENAKGEGEEEKSDTLPELREGRKLLVAVDTSQASMDACKWVVENIYRQGDHVYLYHMVPFIPPEAFSVFDFSALVNATPVDRAVFKALDPFEEGFGSI
eukprot:gene1217-32558_t